ncbi:MAG TPA: DUF3194 domain-containing protein [Candidatus Deferrimicrobium sp.]|nr:DUF3194 domain-containing protein [Candidatus Deferrimicrobium sp.]
MNQKFSFSIKDLSPEQLEDLLFQAEQEGRKYILSQIPSKELKTFDILIEFDTNERNIDCSIDIELVKHSQLDPQKITEKAAQIVFESIETFLKSDE